MNRQVDTRSRVADSSTRTARHHMEQVHRTSTRRQAPLFARHAKSLQHGGGRLFQSHFNISEVGRFFSEDAIALPSLSEDDARIHDVSERQAAGSALHIDNEWENRALGQRRQNRRTFATKARASACNILRAHAVVTIQT